MYLGLTLVELMEVVRTCDSIEIEDCTPPYNRSTALNVPSFWITVKNTFGGASIMRASTS